MNHRKGSPISKLLAVAGLVAALVLVGSIWFSAGQQAVGTRPGFDVVSETGSDSYGFPAAGGPSRPDLKWRGDIVTPEMVEDFLKSVPDAMESRAERVVDEADGHQNSRDGVSMGGPSRPVFDSPYARAAVSRRADPPFGPPVLPILVGPGYTIEDWERAYYKARPEEYERFVEFFGDILDEE